ncbi:MAG: hypothetical protein EPN62_00950 [Candidimonas sp.]|nr:MAG: hypothetical protein EPN77_01950 [Candidimonas sp.]TAM26894.1 MAG: hypothetical protein EPN62_00950 [Candidimonas sp.]
MENGVFLGATPHELKMLILGALIGPVAMIAFRLVKKLGKFTFSYPFDDFESVFNWVVITATGACFAYFAAQPRVNGSAVAIMIFDSWLIYWCFRDQWRHIMKKIGDEHLKQPHKGSKSDEPTP